MECEKGKILTNIGNLQSSLFFFPERLKTPKNASIMIDVGGKSILFNGCLVTSIGLSVIML